MTPYEYINRHRRGPRRWAALVCLAGLGLSPGAHAYLAEVGSQIVDGTVVNEATHIDRSWTVDGTGSDGSTKIGKKFVARAPGGRALESRMTAKLSASAAVKYGARLLPTIGLAVGVGSVVYDIYDAVRVRPDGAGGLVIDPGQAPTSTGVVKCSGFGKVFYGRSPLEACEPLGAVYVATQPAGAVSLVGTWSCQPGASGQCQILTRWVWGDEQLVFGSFQQTVQEQCPAYVDSTGRQHGAGEPKLTSGDCPTGRYNPATVADAEARLRENWQGTSTQVDLAAMWDDILNRTPAALELPTDTPLEAAEPTPNPLAGPVSTTSNADGTTSTEAVGWNFTRIADGLGNKRLFKVTETKKTTVKDAAGNVVSETTTGTTGGTSGAGISNCDSNPGALGCIGLGQAPEVATPKSTKNIAWETAVLGLPVGCPVDVVVSGKHFSYVQTCEVATKAKPFVLAGAAFSALMIVLATVRGGS